MISITGCDLIALEHYAKAKVMVPPGSISLYRTCLPLHPPYADSLIGRFQNPYFDTAFGGSNSNYSLSNQRNARVRQSDGGPKAEWRDLVAA